MMNDCRLLDGMAATRWSLKYSSESVFDGQSERTKSRAGRWDALFRIRLFHPHEAHPQKPSWFATSSMDREEKKRGKDRRGERGEGKKSIVSFNDNRHGRRTFDRINRLVSMVLLNITEAREKC